MGFFQRAKRTIKPFIDVPRWIGADSLIQHGKNIISMAKGLFIVSKPTYTETFEEALQRLHLTEQDVQDRIKQFKLFGQIFYIGTLLLFFYCIYLLFAKAFLAFLASFGLMLLLLGQGFRYHFWLYQMQERKLGCSFAEWYKNGLMRIIK